MFINNHLTLSRYVCCMKKPIYLLILMMVNAFDLFAPEPAPGIAPKNPVKVVPTEVSILSWNIAMLPVFDFVHAGRDRARSIGTALRERNYDIIVFQEAFSPFARRSIKMSLKKAYPYEYGPANAGISLRINSGVWILSRIPLKVVREYKFSGCQGFDCLSRKGAIMLEGRLNDQTFQLIGTHLDSDENDPASGS